MLYQAIIQKSVLNLRCTLSELHNDENIFYISLILEHTKCYKNIFLSLQISSSYNSSKGGKCKYFFIFVLYHFIVLSKLINPRVLKRFKHL